MVQWTPSVDALFFKVVLKVHDIKVDYKKAEEALREEGIDVTAKALMHRITKLKATQAEPGEPGKASPMKSAKRAADGKPKEVLPDPEDEDAGVGAEPEETEVKPTVPKTKKPRTVKPKVEGGKGTSKPKKAAPKKAKKEESDEDSPAPLSDHGDDDVI
ncbi:MAG: hypothetical protein Q9195_005428 [Heterodermia aff. obscurata]